MKKVSALFSGLVVATLLASLASGCADENDPKTWAKRLDDPAQRVPSIKRLDQFFNDAMSGATTPVKKEDPKVKTVLDDAVEPLAKTYIAGGLDEKTRKDLMKLLGDMGDPRAAPAYAKAFKDFESGKNDDDVKYAAQGTITLAKTGQPIDQSLVDALWDCFAKFQPSKNNKSITLVQNLKDAVLAVKDKSYGQKAVDKIGAPVTDPKEPAQGMDQIQFWQAISIRLIGELKFTAGIKPLVKVLLTPAKADLAASVRLALTKMPKESEPVLISALKGTDPDFAKLAEAYPNKGYIPRVAEPLAYISRPAGRDAYLDTLAAADTDDNRVFLASVLTQFPSDARNTGAFVTAYNKVPPTASLELFRGSNGRAILSQASANFFDPSMTEWLLKELAAAKGETADAMQPTALQAAMKLMTVSNEKAVGDAVAKIQGPATEKDMFKAASAVLDKCKQDPACFVHVLDTPVPSSPAAAKMGHVKAAWMAGIYGNDKVKNDLVAKVDSIKDPTVRLAMIEAVDHLAPTGDVAAATQFEKIADADTAAHVQFADDELVKIALKLRSRVP